MRIAARAGWIQPVFRHGRDMIAFESNGGNLTAALTHAQELATLELGNAQIFALVDDLAYLGKADDTARWKAIRCS